MNFHDWSKAIVNLQEQIKDFCPDPIIESLQLQSSDPKHMMREESISIQLGKHFEIVVNETKYNDIKWVRHDGWRQYKTRLIDLLTMLTKRVNLVVAQRDALIIALAEPALPEAALKRMRGEEGIDDKAVLGLLVDKYLQELVEMISQAKLRGQFELFLKRIAQRMFCLNRKDQLTKMTTITFGSINLTFSNTAKKLQQSYLSSLEDQIFFVANIELIKVRLAALLDGLKNLKRMLEE